MERVFFKTPAYVKFNAKEIFLLNGFIKKSTADYDKQIAIALKIMEDIL